MRELLLKWWIVLILLAVAVTAALVVSLVLFRSGDAANFHSIFGFYLSLLGFALTIYALFETQKANKASQEAAQKAAQDAARVVEDVRRALAGAVAQARREVRALDCAALQGFLTEIRHAQKNAEWDHARFCV
jgi:type VI protein secretion system component VasK